MATAIFSQGCTWPEAYLRSVSWCSENPAPPDDLDDSQKAGYNKQGWVLGFLVFLCTFGGLKQDGRLGLTGWQVSRIITGFMKFQLNTMDFWKDLA